MGNGIKIFRIGVIIFSDKSAKRDTFLPLIKVFLEQELRPKLTHDTIIYIAAATQLGGTMNCQNKILNKNSFN